MIIICIVITSLLVILSTKIEISVFSLILTFALSGILFISIGVPFFGFIYLLVYTAAISILFLFVIMMLDLPNSPRYTSVWHLPLTIGGIISFISILFPQVITTQGLINSFGKKMGSDPNHQLSELSATTYAHDTIIYHQEWSIQSLDVMQGLAYTLYTEQASLLLTLVFILLLVMVALISHLYKSSS